MPIYGECGGFMYLCKEIWDQNGIRYPMSGCFPFATKMFTRLKSLGYREIALTKDTIIGKSGQRIRGHEFHYSELTKLSPDVVTVYQIADRVGMKKPPDGYLVNRTLGSYNHLHFGSQQEAAKHFVDQFHRHVGNKHENIAVSGLKTFHEIRQFRLIEELGDIGFKFPIFGFHPGHALGAKTGYDLLCVLILEDILAQPLRLALDINSLNTSATAEDLSKNAVVRFGENIGGVLEGHAKPEVRLVRARAVHSIRPCHARKGTGQLNPSNLEHSNRKFLEKGINEFFINERRLQIKLCEFWLSVGTKVFITEASDNLKIPLHATHHKELLEKLR